MKPDAWSAFQRKPENERVDVPWNSDWKPKLIGKIRRWGEHETNDSYEFDKGILEPDVFFAGLEDEIARVAKRMSDVE